MGTLRIERSKLLVPIVVVALGLTATCVRAQDAVKVCPNNFKVLAEDDTTRVLHFTQRKGERAACIRIRTSWPMSSWVAGSLLSRRMERKQRTQSRSGLCCPARTYNARSRISGRGC